MEISDGKPIWKVKKKLWSRQRLCIPALFRKHLPDELLLFKDDHSDVRSLVIYGPEEFEEFVDSVLSNIPSEDQIKVAMAGIKIHSNTTEVIVQSDGSIRIPQNCLEFAGIKDYVSLVGMRDHIEIHAE